MGESNVQPSRVELTLRECLLAEAIESANDSEVAKLKDRIDELEAEKAALKAEIKIAPWMACEKCGTEHNPGVLHRVKELEEALEPFAAWRTIEEAALRGEDTDSSEQALKASWFDNVLRARSALEKPSPLPTKDAS